LTYYPNKDRGHENNKAPITPASSIDYEISNANENCHAKYIEERRLSLNARKSKAHLDIGCSCI